MNLLSVIFRLLAALSGDSSASSAASRSKSSARKASIDLSPSSRPKRSSSSASSVRVSSLPSLRSLAGRYEDELADRTFVYTLSESGKKPVKAEVEYERSGFCHLFSIASASGDSSDENLAGMKGWRAVQNGDITFEGLQAACPEQFDYYAIEWGMMDELIETACNPKAVRFVKEKVSNSRLQADVLLYRTFGDRTVHIALSKGRDGDWFVRSYFVRENARDRLYPTKYIAGMPALEVKTAVKQ